MQVTQDKLKIVFTTVLHSISIQEFYVSSIIEVKKKDPGTKILLQKVKFLMSDVLIFGSECSVNFWNHKHKKFKRPFAVLG